MTQNYHIMIGLVGEQILLRKMTQIKLGLTLISISLL